MTRRDVDHLRAIAGKLRSLSDPCVLCPRRCGARREAGEKGICGEDGTLRLGGYSLHRGEEPPLSGRDPETGREGSGTVFVSGCSLRCLYCQNGAISQGGLGFPADPERLGEIFLELQARGARNVNWVTPGHALPALVAGLAAARERGFALPVVYNSSGYERPEVLVLLEGIVDVYLMDLRYAVPLSARAGSRAPDYPEANRAALRESFRQVGAFRESYYRGLIVRHLMLPGRLEETRTALEFIAWDLSPSVPVSLMNQYAPKHRAVGDPEWGRAVDPADYARAVEILDRLGLTEGWTQEE
ncbi:MAG: radical SAM protein [Deltaproteobacteria bacterium]|nr:radical SAM protein [Deltaproteobacteria bacterium]